MLSQACVISGISGAGKTESSKSFVRHVLALSDVDAGDGDGVHDSSSLVSKICVVSEFIEAFGNAKTELNANSSRFGQCVTPLAFSFVRVETEGEKSQTA